MASDFPPPNHHAKVDWRAYVRERLQLPRLVPEREAEAIEELAQQIEDLSQEAMASGADDAAIRALIDQHIPDWARLSTELMREDAKHALARDRQWRDGADSHNDVWWRRTATGLIGDVWFSARTLRKNPSFALTSIVTLALGIGAAAALFSIVNALLLQPLPFRDSDRLVRLTSLRPNGEAGGISYPDFEDWQAQSRTVEEMAVYSARSFVLDSADRVSRVRGAVVSLGLFDLLGASASLGRTFLPGEDAPGPQDDVVVLSHGMWRDQFGSDPQILGRSIRIDGRPATVIGVMDRRFRFPIGEEPADLWLTIAVDRRSSDGHDPMAAQRGVHYLSGRARLRPEVTIDQAQAELGAIVSAQNQQHPENNPRGIRVRSELAELVADVRSEWLALFGASACLLLIACANVINMLLARSASRRHEVAMRIAIGASRWRLVRQLLIEHAIVGTLGGAAGVGFAAWGIDLIRSAAPSSIPRLADASLNAQVILFAVAASVIAIAIFGIVPALRLSTQDPARLSGLADRSQDASGGRVRQVIVIAQTALAVVLLVAGGLLIRTVVSLNRVELGYDAANVWSFRVDLPNHYTPASERRFLDDTLDSMRSIPGVAGASAAYAVPLSGNEFITTTEVEGRPQTGERDEATFNIVEPGYFQTLGIRISKGRDFTARDRLDAVPVAIVNEAFVRRYLGDQEPLGKRVRPGIGNGYDKEPLREIVAVVGDVRSGALRNAPPAEIYVPAAQCPSIGSTTVVVRSVVDQTRFASEAQRMVSKLDRTIPIFAVKTLEEYASEWVLEPRFSSLLLGLFAALSSALAAIGLYGLISYSVAQRTREIGVRIALGAAPRGVMTLVLRQGVGIALAGVGIGLVLALLFTGWFAAELYGVGPRDPITLLAVAIVLLLSAVAACTLPALRALRIDPIAALRGE